MSLSSRLFLKTTSALLAVAVILHGEVNAIQEELDRKVSDWMKQVRDER